MELTTLVGQELLGSVERKIYNTVSNYFCFKGDLILEVDDAGIPTVISLGEVKEQLNEYREGEEKGTYAFGAPTNEMQALEAVIAIYN